MSNGEGNREDFIARASARKVRVARLGGFWWDDNWITPALAYRIHPAEKISEIYISGWNPDVSGMENNQLWIEFQNHTHNYPRLLRGKAFEFAIPVTGDSVRPFELTIATLAELEGDKRDLRARGCHLYALKFR